MKYQVRKFTPDDIEPVAQIYADSWATMIPFVKVLGLKRDDLYAIALNISQFSARYPLSTVMVDDDDSQTIVAYALNIPYSELSGYISSYNDMICSPRTKMWISLLDIVDELAHPYLAVIDKDKLVYSFSMGVHKDHIGHGLYRVLYDSTTQLLKGSGYLYAIGCSVKFSEVRKAEEDPLSYILIRFDWRNWVYHGVKPYRHARSPYITYAINCHTPDTFYQLEETFMSIHPKL
eukprot:TRINITY_DN13176_c0_g1_i1.p1 TRINITY_DN13176_c0_g1~~TRINITY_DN13176_c0_g1_i1.p1  ORF type:complete len:234 (+),score=28.09 TRINITY_DN13176_c0_g1_i1:101-802(+)